MLKRTLLTFTFIILLSTLVSARSDRTWIFDTGNVTISPNTFSNPKAVCLFDGTNCPSNGSGGGGGGGNLTLPDWLINWSSSRIGNWTASQPNYVNFTVLNTMSNLTLAQIVLNIQNWSLDRSNYVNLTALGNTSIVRVGTNKTCAAGFTLQNVSLAVTGLSGDCVAGTGGGGTGMTSFQLLLGNGTGQTFINNSVGYFKNSSGILLAFDQNNFSWDFDYASAVANFGNWSLDRPNYVNFSVLNGAIGQNLTHALIVQAEGNWSSDRPNYVNFTALNGAVGQNLTHALVVQAEGNWSLDRPNYVNFSVLNGAVGQNLTHALVVQAEGNWSLDRSNYVNFSVLNGAVGQNLTHALVVQAEGNWSADKSTYLQNNTHANFTKLSINTSVQITYNGSCFNFTGATSQWLVC